MILLNFLLSLSLYFTPYQPDKIWHRKTLQYEIYCKERNGFYTVELKGPKYYSIDNINSGDTTIRKAFQAVVYNEKGKLYYFDTKIGKCRLKEIYQTDVVRQKRLTLFYNVLETEIKSKSGIDKVPMYKDIQGDFEEYDKTGDIDKVIQKYSKQ